MNLIDIREPFYLAVSTPLNIPESYTLYQSHQSMEPIICHQSWSPIFLSEENSSAPASVLGSGLPTFMIVNSAAYWTYLPTPLVLQIYEDVGAQWDSITGAGLIRNCSATLNFNITFLFKGVELSIPLSQLSSLPQNDTCILGLASSAGNSAILGGSFLCSIYSVFDLSKNEISFVQRNFQSGPDQILEIGGNSTLLGVVLISVTPTAIATVPTKF